MSGRVASIWITRLLLALLLFFGGEVLLWTRLLDYSPIDWIVRIIGYSVLAVFLLDIAVRYRIRDIYDAIIICGMYGLLVSLLITPEVSFENFPRSFLTRVMGGHVLLGWEMWGFFLVLTAGNKRCYRFLLLSVAAWLGFYWGIWMRWSPELSGLFNTVSLQSMFSIAGICLMLAMIFYFVLTRFDVTHAPQDFQLPNPQWWILFSVMVLLFLYQFYIVGMSVWAVVVTALVMVVCWSVIWFRREDTGDTLLDNHFPIKPLSPLWIILAGAIFVATTLISFNLPLVGTGRINQLWLMEMGFAAVGSLWLPMVAAILATRGLDRQMRSNELL